MSNTIKVDSMRLGANIRRIRRENGFMQYILAENAGIRAITLCRIENGHFIPSLATLKGISRALKVSIDELVG